MPWPTKLICFVVSAMAASSAEGFPPNDFAIVLCKIINLFFKSGASQCFAWGSKSKRFWIWENEVTADSIDTDKANSDRK